MYWNFALLVCALRSLQSGRPRLGCIAYSINLQPKIMQQKNCRAKRALGRVDWLQLRLQIAQLAHVQAACKSFLLPLKGAPLARLYTPLPLPLPCCSSKAANKTTRSKEKYAKIIFKMTFYLAWQPIWLSGLWLPACVCPLPPPPSHLFPLPFCMCVCVSC